VAAQSYVVKGEVKDVGTQTAVDMANVSILELAQGTMTDEKGIFELKKINKGTFHLRISYLGYETVDTLIRIEKAVFLKFSLIKTSLQLKEVNVMAREKKQSATTSTIKLAAIEHLQPSSLTDILQMLPGGLLSDSKLNVANQVSMRQAGSDVNTAMGTAIVQDGVPMSANSNMQSIYGVSSTDVSASKSPVNSGVDMRQISTDNIEEVEIIRGIPSVKYGDLTSGVIIVKSKKGETPLNLRVKSDPLNKLVYVGKGYRLPKDGGTINFGIDYTKFVADQRSPFDQYQRITSSLSYGRIIGKKFLSTTQVGFTGTIDKQVMDPDIMTKEDTYKSDYNNFKLSNSGVWNINNGFLNKIDYTISANYAQNILKRTSVVSGNSIGISLNNSESEMEGFYLPSEYLSNYLIDGKPFNFYAQATTSLQPKFGKTFNNIILGAEFRLDKNFGDGALYDLTRPPFPNQSSSSRPRAPKEIASMQKSTFFVEDNFSASLGTTKLRIILGLRGTMLSNIVAKSAIYHKLFTEPRLNVNLQLPKFNLFNSSMEIGLKAGIGDQVKFPTVLQLYPENAYYDVPELNYYSQIANSRMIYLLTKIQNRTNLDLTPARNRKMEVGFDLNYMGMTLNITAFHENENNGFEQQSLYFSQKYTNYIEDNDPNTTVVGKPTISYDTDGKPSFYGFTSQTKYKFLGYSYTTNAAVVIKDGIEYQFSTKKIKPINTEIVLSGAWFRTKYDISQPRYEYPTVVTGENNYPYVAVFNIGNDSKTREQFNTTVYFNTHFPRQRLLFSTSLQALWYTSYKMLAYDSSPNFYITLDGVTHPFTEVEKADNAFKELLEEHNAAYFDDERTPVSVELNLKVTKEIGNNLKLSFFVNRLLDYNPRYTTRFGMAAQKWVTPFMGAEVQVKL
jgi:hypothetical protein